MFYRFTVFTPTYNRAHTLPRVYESLKRQTCHDFEWLIVDDGSTDNTQEIIASWQTVAIAQVFSVGAEAQEFGSSQFFFLSLKRVVLTGFELVDAFLVDVKADDRA